MSTLIRYCLLFLICVIAQALIFNQIAIFNVAIPFVFIYFIVRLPINLKLSIVFTVSFILGLCVDIFSDTPGVNALACTLVAALRVPIYYAYMAKDDITSRLTPCVSTMGLADYAKYLLTFVVIYCLFVFVIEYFNFADVKSIAILTASSAALTFLILLAVDCMIPARSLSK